MSNNILKRGLQQSVDNQPIVDGKFYFSIDQGRMFMDIANERVELSDFIRGLSYEEIINLDSPLPKMYLSTDTRQLLSYDFTNEQWVSYSGGCDPTVIAEMQTKINDMQKTLDRYERVIEIIEQEYGLLDE